MATTPATNQAAKDEDPPTEVSNTDVAADMPQRYAAYRDNRLTVLTVTDSRNPKL